MNFKLKFDLKMGKTGLKQEVKIREMGSKTKGNNLQKFCGNWAQKRM